MAFTVVESKQTPASPILFKLYITTGFFSNELAYSGIEKPSMQFRLCSITDIEIFSRFR